jgi:hypothetical protein
MRSLFRTNETLYLQKADSYAKTKHVTFCLLRINCLIISKTQSLPPNLYKSISRPKKRDTMNRLGLLQPSELTPTQRENYDIMHKYTTSNYSNK